MELLNIWVVGQKIYIFFNHIFKKHQKSTKFGCIHLFSQKRWKNTQYVKNWVHSQPYFFIFEMGRSLRPTQDFFFLGLMVHQCCARCICKRQDTGVSKQRSQKIEIHSKMSFPAIFIKRNTVVPFLSRLNFIQKRDRWLIISYRVHSIYVCM